MVASEEEDSEQEVLKYFWHGIPQAACKKLEERTLQVTPNLDWLEPPMDIIVTAPECIFNISLNFIDDDDDLEGPEKADSNDGLDSNSEGS